MLDLLPALESWCRYIDEESSIYNSRCNSRNTAGIYIYIVARRWSCTVIHRHMYRIPVTNLPRNIFWISIAEKSRETRYIPTSTWLSSRDRSEILSARPWRGAERNRPVSVIRLLTLRSFSTCYCSWVPEVVVERMLGKVSRRWITTGIPASTGCSQTPDLPFSKSIEVLECKFTRL